MAHKECNNKLGHSTPPCPCEGLQTKYHKKTHERYDHRSKWVDGQGSAKRFDELTKEVVVASYRRRFIVLIIGVAAFL